MRSRLRTIAGGDSKKPIIHLQVVRECQLAETKVVSHRNTAGGYPVADRRLTYGHGGGDSGDSPQGDDELANVHGICISRSVMVCNILQLPVHTALHDDIIIAMSRSRAAALRRGIKEHDDEGELPVIHIDGAVKASCSPSAIGRRLRLIRQYLGRDGRPVGQEALGRSLGVAQPTVSSWESGKAEVSTIALKKLEKLSGIPAYWVLFGEEPLGLTQEMRLSIIRLEQMDDVAN